MFDEITGVMNDEALELEVVNMRLPPVNASYHLNVPVFTEEALSKTEPDPHTEPFVAAGADGSALTVTSTAVLDAVVQEPLSNST